MKLLISGCNRSGTTLLASLIGAHKDIAILNEDYFDGLERIIGKKYQGIKMPIPRISFDKKVIY